ncbi:hypothetical protein [Streptomyces sp. bgisy154]|uniref:hypothetical protein n=1 Tax=Streptomyces sp. bgisy154 TaxID=3413794 RepID=UPI003D71DBFE
MSPSEGLGHGNGSFAPRVRIGAGWNTSDHLAALGDADREGRPDLYATRLGDEGHEPYLYRGTGAWRAPFAPRAQIGMLFLRLRPYDLFV